MPHVPSPRPPRPRLRTGLVAAAGTALLAALLAPVATAAGPAPAAPASYVETARTAAAAEPQVVPLPRVSEPLPTTRRSHAFGGSAFTKRPGDLAAVGYEEQEYLVRGTANVYDWPADGPAVVRTPDARYVTRILVRRPVAANDYSGNVVVEPLNPSNLFDLNIGWAMMHRQLVRSGDAWVGVTVKPVSAQALKNFDRDRYGALSFANPLPLDDPQNCTTVADDSRRTTENGLAWDIMSQVGRLVRTPRAGNPVEYGPRARTQHVYGFGYSQTGGYMYDYINAIQPIAERPGGGTIYDGYVVAVAGGAFVGAVPINQCVPAPPVDDPRRQLSDVGVPVIHVMSQSDYLTGIAGRRLDSDAPGDEFRHYEMAGAGHATPDELTFSARPADIVAAGRDVPPVACDQGPRSRFPSRIFFDAILANLDAWVRDGTPPPHGSPIVVKAGEPREDRFGNVRGGLRSPYLDVPTSRWEGSSTGASFCFIAGHEVPFSQARLDRLYPSHAAYVAQVRTSAQRLAERGFVTDYDARAMVAEAVAADVP